MTVFLLITLILIMTFVYIIKCTMIMYPSHSWLTTRHVVFRLQQADQAMEA